jgi:RNA polymerase sigma-70 factor (ECF subfamily)
VSVLAHSLDDGRSPERLADGLDPNRGDFLVQAEPYRRELLAHCYRMTGSLHDAEDLVQETFLRAWKSYDRFEGKSSVRTWLHRIATNTCLTSLEGRQRRPLPTGLGAPSSQPTDELVERGEVLWLEPLPDSLTEDPADPSTIVGSRESVRLAFVAALQHLSPRQRAVLVLRDVLQWKAAEVADAIGASVAAVNSLLQRARAQLDAVGPSQDDQLSPPESAEAREQLARYISAFEDYDIERLVEMFTAEAIWEMPPFDAWYQGGPAIGALIHHNCPANSADDMRLLPLTANGQPAAAMYMRLPETDGRHVPFQLHVLDLGPDGISHVVAFLDTSLFAKFGLPEAL